MVNAQGFSLMIFSSMFHIWFLKLKTIIEHAPKVILCIGVCRLNFLE